MAEQIGIIPLKGTIGNINFFKSGDGKAETRLRNELYFSDASPEGDSSVVFGLLHLTQFIFCISCLPKLSSMRFRFLSCLHRQRK